MGFIQGHASPLPAMVWLKGACNKNKTKRYPDGEPMITCKPGTYGWRQLYNIWFNIIYIYKKDTIVFIYIYIIVYIYICVCIYFSFIYTCYLFGTPRWLIPVDFSGHCEVTGVHYGALTRLQTVYMVNISEYMYIHIIYIYIIYIIYFIIYYIYMMEVS